jgi:uncharacterized protein YciI
MTMLTRRTNLPHAAGVAAVLMLCLAAGVVAPPARAAGMDTSHMGTVFLVLLKKGPAWSAEKTPESKAIQEGHLANISALWKAGKLAVAGPLGDDGDLRGIFIFQVATLEEAKALTDSDPAIKAGRLVAEIHPWWVDNRALPAAGKYCQSVDPDPPK